MQKPNNQPIEPVERLYPDEVDIQEIFYTIQGEGPFTGRPAIFIRLAGCNLQCPGCDTDYTSGRKIKHIEDILIEARGRWPHLVARPLVVITGGEPFRQDISVLINCFLAWCWDVQIETNGTAPAPEGVDDWTKVTVVVSPKLGKIHPSVLRLPESSTYWKYVLKADDIDPTDGLPIHALENPLPKTQLRVARPPKGTRGDKIYVNPMDEKDNHRNELNAAAVASSSMIYGYTAGVQLHKLLNLE